MVQAVRNNKNNSSVAGFPLRTGVGHIFSLGVLPEKMVKTLLWGGDDRLEEATNNVQVGALHVLSLPWV